VPGALAQLSLVVAAEKSKVPFYIAGGLLAVWALVVSIGIGLRRPRFPGNLIGERVVIAITAVLVAGALTTAVTTSSAPVKTGEETATASKPQGSSTGGTPSGGQSGAAAPSTGAQAKTAPAPKATTGTPAPPSSPGRTAPAQAVKLSAAAGGQLAFDTKQLSAQAGSVTITLANPSPLEHDVTIAEGSKVLGATPTFTSGTRSVKLTLKPGTYTFYCSVPGHRQAGMEGTLSVT
jgi:plastocyanin